MFVCRAPAYPPKTGPTKKFFCLSENFFIFFLFFSNSVNKPFFKIIERFILLEVRLIQRLLLYAFLAYVQHL